MTPEDVDAMRQRHVDWTVNLGNGRAARICKRCEDPWPCDAVRALDALEETVLAARFNDSAYVRSVNAERARAEAAETALAEAVWNHAELARRLAAVLAILDNGGYPLLGIPQRLVADVRAAATGSP